MVLFCLPAPERFLDLLGHVLRFRSRDREGAHQADEVFFGGFFREMQARQSCRAQQSCETALGIAGFEWNPIQQQFVVGDAQQKPAVSVGGQRVLQLFPGGFKLRFRALVVVAVHPRVLNQDVQAMDKRARRGCACALRCIRAGDKGLLVNAALNFKGKGKK